MDRTDKLSLLITVVIGIFAVVAVAGQMGLLNDANHYDVNLTEVISDLTIIMSIIKLESSTAHILKHQNMSP